MKKAAICSSLALLLPTTAQAAGAWENLDALDERIAEALGAGIGRPGGAAAPLDRRLRLPACGEPATIDIPLADAIAVRCASAGWRIRVPLVVAESARTVPVIRRGDVIELVYEGEGFAATGAGSAMDDGAEGKIIRVKTSQSAAPVTVIVSAMGTARVSR